MIGPDEKMKLADLGARALDALEREFGEEGLAELNLVDAVLVFEVEEMEEGGRSTVLSESLSTRSASAIGMMEIHAAWLKAEFHDGED